MKLRVKQGATNSSTRIFNKDSSKQKEYSSIEKKFKEKNQKIIEKAQIIIETCKKCIFKNDCWLQHSIIKFQNASQKT